MCCIPQIADSDDPFEEIKRARRHPAGVRSEKVPRANVAPFMSEAKPPQKTDLPPSEQDIEEEVKRAPTVVSSRRKRVCTIYKKDCRLRQVEFLSISVLLQN